VVSQDVTRRITPRSRRGVRTRNAIVAAAREVFERDGYLAARISDITATAGVAAGSFYTYFNDKEEVFAALVDIVQEEMLHPHLQERTGITDPRLLIDAANREYLRAYRKNARLMALFEQVAQIDEGFRQRRVARSDAFAQRNAKMIARLQADGQADPSLDPLVAAHALGAMVSRVAYAAFVLNQPVASFEVLIENLNRLWTNALLLEPLQHRPTASPPHNVPHRSMPAP
jgi:AcrR family transcriptional regulator